jgi:rare lipoprotein A
LSKIVLVSGSPIHAVAAIFTMILVALTGCARTAKTKVPSSPVRPAKIGSTETGIASWYGHPYHGRRSASGEIYDMEQFTAAHRTLPFGTWLEVTNLQNRKVVDVRINDRGPFVDGRIIDLSLAAARTIDMVGPGTARVKLKVIAGPSSSTNVPSPGRASPPTPAPSATPAPTASRAARVPQTSVDAELYTVQAASFSDRADAESFQASIRSQFEETRVVQAQSMWRVLIGRQMSLDDANRLAARVQEIAGQALVIKDR